MSTTITTSTTAATTTATTPTSNAAAAAYETPTGSEAVNDFTVLPNEKQPSRKCWGQNLFIPHPWDRNPASALRDWNHVSAPVTCPGRQFTTVRTSADGRVAIDLSTCPTEARFGPTADQLNQRWERTEAGSLVSRSQKSPGVDMVYSSCGKDTNLRIQPYRVAGLPTTPESFGAPSVLWVHVDAISVQRAVRYLPRTWDLLRQMQDAFVFNITGVYGKNSFPNDNELFYKPALSEVAKEKQMVQSVFQDYNDIGFYCHKSIPNTHKVCSNLLGDHITGKVNALYRDNPLPGCAHGQFWIQHHTRFIERMWEIYPAARKFHVTGAYGGHMIRRHRFAVQQNDDIIADFLPRFLEKYPNTAVVLSSDHGLHYTRDQGFNRFAAGEAEHRNPFLAIIPPRGSDGRVDATVRRSMNTNTLRFVTHRDVHKTVLGWISPGTKQTGGMLAYDLTREQVPPGRSCRDAGITDIWCNCFGRAGPTDNKLDEQFGVLSTNNVLAELAAANGGDQGAACREAKRKYRISPGVHFGDLNEASQKGWGAFGCDRQV